MELISRMMDGSISFGDRGFEPAEGGPGATQDDKVDRLEKVPLFQACSGRQLKQLAKIARVFNAQPGTVLTRTGEPGDEFFLIIDGTARVEVSPRKQPRLRAGDFFGEMSLLDGEPRSATVVAETTLRLLVISRRHFATLLNDVPGMAQSLLAILSRRVRAAEHALNS